MTPLNDVVVDENEEEVKPRNADSNEAMRRCIE